MQSVECNTILYAAYKIAIKRRNFKKKNRVQFKNHFPDCNQGHVDGQADSFDRQDDMEVVMNDVDEIPLVERNHNHPFFEFRYRSSEIHEIGFLSRPSGRSLDEIESV